MRLSRLLKNLDIRPTNAMLNRSGTAMRGTDGYNESLFSTVRLEDFFPASHPLRPIRSSMNEALAKMDGKFSSMYESDVKGGRLAGVNYLD